MVARVGASGAGVAERQYGWSQSLHRELRGLPACSTSLKYVLLGPLLRLFFPCKVIGAEYIPADGRRDPGRQPRLGGRLLLHPAAHQAAGDLPGQERVLHREGHQGPAEEVVLHRHGPGADRPQRRVGRARRPEHRRSGCSNEGTLLGIYPEGTRSPDGRLYKGKTGVARMALEAGVPVIPVVMIGTEKVNPIGSKMWRPHRIKMIIGRPLDFSRYEGMAGDRFVERSMTDEIMYRLMELSGQEYVDVYAAKVKADARGGQQAPAPHPGRPGPRPRHRDPAAGHQGRLSRRRLVRPAPTGPVARYFYDCEFIEDGRTIELISIGVVAEDGREFYAVSTEFDPDRANAWVRRHVLDKLPSPADPAWRAAAGIRDDLLRLPRRPGPADRAVGLVRRLRPCRARPSCGAPCRTCRADVPRLTREIRQHWEAAGSPPIPAPGTDRHDALADARLAYHAGGSRRTSLDGRWRER